MSKVIKCPCCNQMLEIVDVGFDIYAYPLPSNMRDSINMNPTSSLYDYYSKIQNTTSEEQLRWMIEQGIVNGVKNNV